MRIGSVVTSTRALALSVAMTIGLLSPASAQWGGGMYGSGKVGQITALDVQSSPAPMTSLLLGVGPVALPAWPSSSTVGVPRPGVWTEVVPLDTFFAPSDYTQNCDNTLVSRIGPGSGGQPTTTYACKLQKAPVVDMQWVRDNLDKQGYTYYITYPLTDHGNGRALISWVKGCWLTGSAQALNGSQPFMCWRGYARLEGAGYVNTNLPFSYCSSVTNITYPPTCTSYASKPYGHATDNIAKWPEPYRSTGVSLMTWTTGLPNGPMNLEDYHYILPIMQPIQDDWLAGTGETAALPQVPPYVPMGDPSPINIGDVSTSGVAGSGVSTAATDRTTVPFDFVAYCNAPAADGRARSPRWVQGCIAASGQMP